LKHLNDLYNDKVNEFQPIIEKLIFRIFISTTLAATREPDRFFIQELLNAKLEFYSRVWSLLAARQTFIHIQTESFLQAYKIK